MKEKGQTFEMFGVVVLGVALIVLLFFLGIFSVKGYTGASGELTERHELESFKAGVNSILYTTEPKTGKTITELLGIASKKGNTTIYFGPGVGSIDVKKELEWRFDAIYGKGNWYLRIPFPNVSADVQIVAVVDTSASMCDEINKLVTDVPEILEGIRAKGKKADMTIFRLGTPSCCIEENGKLVPFDINKAKTTDYFHMTTMPQTYQGLQCKNPCGARGSSDEDWGAGLECAIMMGPYKGPGEFGWRENVIRVAIPISDELPGGIECGCPSAISRRFFDRGMKKAIDEEIYVFGFRGDSCGIANTLRDGVCEREDISNYGGIPYCACSRGAVADWMHDISNATGGEMYNLSYVVDSADAIEKLIMSIQPNRVPYLEAGTIPPKDVKNMRSVTSLLPITVLGKYVELFVYNWNKG